MVIGYGLKCGFWRNDMVERVTDEWNTLSDEQLAEVAHRDLQGRGAWVEAMRRLRIAIENLSVSSDNSAFPAVQRMFDAVP